MVLALAGATVTSVGTIKAAAVAPVRAAIIRLIEGVLPYVSSRRRGGRKKILPYIPKYRIKNR
ncbi:hypothetical protein GCM10022252_00040 [Streptosporangium oxazolinicum]|uniref:Uncharacterized protein n=1 Tax=Streptosporangium oxazolinicum TaxID=909287 RepID=A0ABP8A6W6_9ACTN